MLFFAGKQGLILRKVLCGCGAAAGRHRATRRTTLCVPPPPPPGQKVPVYSLAAAAAAAQPPCVHLPQCCQHYPHLSGRPDCGPAYLRPVGANPRVSPLGTSGHASAPFQGLKLYVARLTPLVRRQQGNYPRGRCDVYL